MKDKRIKILAINPGSKYLGLAVFKDIELVHWATKKLRSKGMSQNQLLQKVKEIVGGLVSDYKPDVVVIEKPAPNRIKNSPALRAIITRIKGLAERKVKKVYSFPPQEVRKHLCQGEKATKMNMEKVIATQYYPWLYHRYEKDRKKDERGQWWKRKYHSCLFEAVALGIYCYQKLKRRPS